MPNTEYTLSLHKPQNVFTLIQPGYTNTVFRKYLKPVMNEMTERINARVNEEKYPVVGKFYNRVYTGTSDIRVQVLHTNKKWWVREYNMPEHVIEEPAHWIPFWALGKWSAAHVKPGYYRWKTVKTLPAGGTYGLQRWLSQNNFIIHHPGSRGNHAVMIEWNSGKIAVHDALRQAMNEILRDNKDHPIP